MPETKNCPYCGEEILAAAKKCKHCGEWLDETTIRKPLSFIMQPIFQRFWGNISFRNCLLILLGTYILLGLIKFLGNQPLTVVAEIIRAFVGVEMALLVIREVTPSDNKPIKAFWLATLSVVFWTTGMIVGVDAETDYHYGYNFSMGHYYWGAAGFAIAVLLDMAAKFLVWKAAINKFKITFVVGLLSSVIFTVFLICLLFLVPLSGFLFIPYGILIAIFYAMLIYKAGSEKVSDIKLNSEGYCKKWGSLVCGALIIGTALYYASRQRVMILDTDGNLIAPLIYEDCDGFSEGLAAVEENGKYGYIDKNGKVVIPMQYDFCHPFSEGRSKVYLIENNKRGYIDKNGNMVIPPKYDWGSDFSEGLAAVEENGKYGYIDKNGKVVIPFSYESHKGSNLHDFHEGLARAERNDKWGFIDKSGNVVIPFEYEYCWDFHEGLARAERNDKWGYINRNNDVVIPFEYESCGDFHEGLALVESNGKRGYIDRNGNMVIPPKYDSARDFSEGLAAVEENGKWGYIDKNGKVVIPLVYKSQPEGFTCYTRDFHEGVALVNSNGKYKYIDKSGNVVFTIVSGPNGMYNEGLICTRGSYISWLIMQIFN